MDEIDSLTKILLDPNATEADRDDAAMDLGRYNDDRALNTLLLSVSNPREAACVVSSCGESIGEIWVARNKFDVAAYHTLPPMAKSEIQEYIKVHKPDWIQLL